MGEPLPQSTPLDSDAVRELAIAVARALDENRGEEIVVVDVEALLPITRFFVIASASSSRALQTLGDAAKEVLSGSGLPRVGVDGSRESHWTCMDFADVVVHLFHNDVRGFYDLDHLWADAPRIDWSAQPGEPSEPGDASESVDASDAGDPADA